MLKRWRGDRWFHAHETARYDALNGLPLATFKQRMWAYCVDFILIAIVWSVFTIPFRHHIEAEQGCKVSFSYMFLKIGEDLKELAESVLYFAIALKLGRGQTPGKKLMKIRVVSLTGHGISWWTSIERALGYGASFLEGGFGFAQYFLNQNRMCVHDRIAETIVIDTRKPRLEAPVHTDAAELAFEAAASRPALHD